MSGCGCFKIEDEEIVQDLIKRLDGHDNAQPVQFFNKSLAKYGTPNLTQSEN